ncbi:Protein of unknown function [Roseateles sp. YR242]|uniref:DUF2917 domain-containing protein n=1 Tax=Roseateles sp. YR242 TaxID=1855305 RepID=UPI0008D15D87|nr:DUF2917 domain-containing protein [Roseateles sp. YR242]SEL49489.1 Protein of unknown function [Roseateles sp. YR242]
MAVTRLSSIQPTPPDLSDAAWQLSQGEAVRLPIGPGRRELRVLEGRVWVTQQGALELPADDYWLSAGDALDVPSGTELVIEAWPTARFQLLVPPQACAQWQARHQVSRPSLLSALVPRLTPA